ncbi:hypothetical protein [Altererythrobacter sp. MF3-039]|uniref:hypothetical protein n=1 Tax=Altererythrobacter sp. MF3-039 TaxID=3252901 RepID=UPI00390CAB22
MKKLIAVVTLAALTACSSAEEAAETEEVAEESQIMAADGKPSYGTFTVTDPDGSVLTEVVIEDGTFTSTDAEGESVTGTWVQKPGEFCTTVDAEGAEERCFSEMVNDEGVWLSTDPDDGTVSIVERIEE